MTFGQGRRFRAANRIAGAFQTRFATPATRFRLAVSCGFVIAAVGCLIVGHGMRVSDAQSWGGMDFSSLIGGGSQRVVDYREPSPQYVRHRAHVARSDSWGRHKHHDDDDSDLVHVGTGGPRRSMCVRLCDGFVFPVGDFHGDLDLRTHEATCQAECPGAKTSLFVIPEGSDSITDASEARTGRNYSELPGAFHYTTYIDGTCSCHPASGNRMKSLLHDFTLRRGDAVMTRAGLRVFHGGASFPFKRNDFVALDRSRDVRKGARANLKAIERASLGAPETVAEIASPRPTAGGKLVGTKTLEHQARN